MHGCGRVHNARCSLRVNGGRIDYPDRFGGVRLVASENPEADSRGLEALDGEEHVVDEIVLDGDGALKK